MTGFLVAALVAGACASDPAAPDADAPSADAAPATDDDHVAELADARLSVGSATAFDRVGVDGLDSDVAMRTVVVVVGADELPRPVLVDEDGPFIIAPVHPTDPDGGELELRLEHPAGEGPTVTLDVAPPDGEDGSFDAARAAPGTVDITAFEDGVTISGAGAGTAVDVAGGGFSAPPVAFSFEFAVTELGDIFPAAELDCFVGGEPPPGL